MERTGISFATLDLVKLEAFIELMFLAAYADGTIAQSEREVFKQQIINGTGGKIGGPTIDAVLKSIEAALVSESRELRLEAIKRRLPEERMRIAALEQAVAVIEADGEVGDAEVAFLLRAAAALGISDDEALSLLHEQDRPTEVS